MKILLKQFAALEGNTKVTSPNKLVKFIFDFGDNTPPITQNSPYITYSKIGRYPIYCVYHLLYGFYIFCVFNLCYLSIHYCSIYCVFNVTLACFN